MKSISYSDVGLVRTNNEDSVYTNDLYNIYIVADGMGGHKAGEVASSLAVNIISKSLKKEKLVDDEKMRHALEEANKGIFSESKVGDKHNMGTTVTVIKAYEDRLCLGHIGDSRAYLIRDGLLIKLTEDHTYVEKLYQEGIINFKEYENHPKKNILLKALGISGEIEPQILDVNLLPNDMIFMCSDGTYQHMESDEIIKLSQLPSLEHSIKYVKNLVDNRGATDNFSFVIIKKDKIGGYNAW